MITENFEKYNIIGLMSGTSLDGLDIAFCEFLKTNNGFDFKIICAETIGYSEDWIKRLLKAEDCSSFEFAELHVNYGHYLGQQVADFIKRHNLKDIDAVASHGHTIFHQTNKHVTFQIGSGASLAAECRQQVVCDFRSVDVALKGQGAPLVPIGDALLFGEYDYCLNLGGFSNISYANNNSRIAFDICPVNIVMNTLAMQKGMEYDASGNMARSGKIIPELLDKLNSLAFYKTLPPKSLGKEWVLEHVTPLMEGDIKNTIEDKLRTLVEHIAIQISAIISANKANGRMLVTGGGAHNDFLIERMRENSPALDIVIRDKLSIDYKEALIFAFLGMLRLRGENNCLKSVTGAVEDNCGGAIYKGK